MSQMSSYASLANSALSLAGTGAQIYGQVRQGQQEKALTAAQKQLAETQVAARGQALAADRDADAQQRAIQLAAALSGADAQQASSGVQPGDGSAAAVASGIRQRAAAAQDASDQQFNTQLAAQPRSLLQSDGSFGSFLQAGRSFGSALQSLIG